MLNILRNADASSLFSSVYMNRYDMVRLLPYMLDSNWLVATGMTHLFLTRFLRDGHADLIDNMK